MRFTAVIFLLAACNHEALSANIADDVMKHGLVRDRRQAQKRKNVDEPSRVINYYFNDDLLSRKSAMILFLRVALAWEKDTCVKFKMHKTVTSILVRADNGRECSYTDNNPRAKMMYIGCGYFGGVAHEVGHALGLEHTHNRHDRDEYLIVNWTNVEKEFEDMSKKVTGMTLESYKEQYKAMTKEENKNYGVPYDYGSIMHYSSAGPNPTMIPKDKHYRRTMGSPFISFTDLAVVNKHYKCEELCDSDKSANCANGGFPNPNNCSICVCPGGYGGQLCDEQPEGCSKLLNATDKWKKVKRQIYKPRNYEGYYKCTNWIKAPDGKKIEVKVEEISPGLEMEGCILAGIEIKTKDQRLTGYRFCSEEDAGITLKSDLNLVPFITYSINSTKWLNVTLSYRYV